MRLKLSVIVVSLPVVGGAEEALGGHVLAG
jgi:hypothetical protein